MPGFNEFDKHNREFNKTLSRSSVDKRQRDYAVSTYFCHRGLSVNFVKHKVRGGILIFKYNCQTPSGPVTMERRVDLWDFSEQDKPIKYQKNVDVWFNGSTFIQQ